MRTSYNVALCTYRTVPDGLSQKYRGIAQGTLSGLRGKNHGTLYLDIYNIFKLPT